MSIAQISPNAVATPQQFVPPTKSDPTNAAQDTNMSAQKAIKAAQTDTVTISKQAVQLVNDGDTGAQEIKESAAEKASETLRGKK